MKKFIVVVLMLVCSVCWAEEIQLMSPRNQTEAYFQNTCFYKTNYDYAISRCGSPTKVIQGADVYVATWVRYLDDAQTRVDDRLHLTFRKSDNILVGCSYEKVKRN